jgi:DNA-directed RNA polymerase III subunit RPC1
VYDISWKAAELTCPKSIIIIPKRNRLRIYVDGADKYYRLRDLKRALPDVVVKVSGMLIRLAHIVTGLQGVPTIARAVINVKDKTDDRGEKGKKELLVEGYGLQKVMTTEGTSV